MRAASPEPLVIACGGGAVLDADNRRALRDAGVVVWLKAAPEVLSGRCGAGGAVRPLLAGSGSAPAAATLERLAVLRADTYAAAAHAVVDTDDRSLDEVAADVVARRSRGELGVSVVRVEVTPPYDVVVAPGALGDAGSVLSGFRRVALVSQAAGRGAVRRRGARRARRRGRGLPHG